MKYETRNLRKIHDECDKGNRLTEFQNTLHWCKPLVELAARMLFLSQTLAPVFSMSFLPGRVLGAMKNNFCMVYNCFNLMA